MFLDLVIERNKELKEMFEKKEHMVKEEEVTMIKTNLIIKDSCIECGACLTCGIDFLYANTDGTIGVKSGVILSECDKTYKQLKDCCPVNAFELDKTIDKKTLLVDMVNELANNCLLKNITTSDVRFIKKEYNISLPSSSGHRRYDYSSYDRAQRAGLQEAKSKMFSRLDSIIMSVVSEYIVKKGKPYYSDSIEEGSVYVKNNNKINDLLNGIKNVLGNGLPASFGDVNFIPSSSFEWKDLRKGEYIGRDMLDYVKSEYDYSIDNYDCYIDVDDREVCVGTNWRGDNKYKDKYCYENLSSCYKEMANDILDACSYADDDLEEALVCRVNLIFQEYNYKMKEIINGKIEEIEKASGIKFKKI